MDYRHAEVHLQGAGDQHGSFAHILKVGVNAGQAGVEIHADWQHWFPYRNLRDLYPVNRALSMRTSSCMPLIPTPRNTWGKGLKLTFGIRGNGFPAPARHIRERFP